MLDELSNIHGMRRTNVIRAWSEQTAASGDGLRAVGPTLYMGNSPVACWLDRADEDGAQIALCALSVGRPWVFADIRETVASLECVLLRVPHPVVSPTPEQHAENLGHLNAAWHKSILQTASTERHAWGHYSGAKRYEKAARLYAWAFDLPPPRLNLARGVLSRAQRNAAASKRKPPKLEPSREFVRAVWRAGRGAPSILVRPIMLRLSQDKERIETSDGESVALADAPMDSLWELACDCRKRREARIWRIVSERPRVGRWTVQAIYANGSIKIACHTLPFDEIARLVLELRQR